MSLQIIKMKAYCKTALLGCLILTTTSGAWAQGSFKLSKNADFSTEDRLFSRDDTMFMRVVAPQVDFTDIDENDYRLKPNEGPEDDNDFEDSFMNRLDGSYEASLSLATADPAVTDWEWRANIRDKSGNRFETRVVLQIIDSQPQQVTLTGKIDSLGVDFLLINSQTILTNSETVFLNDLNEVISFQDLQVDLLAEVIALTTENADLLATQIKLLEAPPVQITGDIESINDSSLVVLGITFFVDTNTEVLDVNSFPIQFSQLATGNLVEVRAQRNSDGKLLASRIKVQDTGSSEIQVTELITAINDSVVTVDSLQFRVTQSTEILDNNDNPITLASLSIGLRVEIRAQTGPNGVLLATRIKVEDPVFGEDEVEVTGLVINIGTDFITVGSDIFTVDGQTVILDDKNNPISLSDIQVGFTVEVRANVLPDGSLLATKISVEDFFQDEIEVLGVIESITDSILVVSDLSFVVSDSTEILDGNNNATTLNTLAKGDIVEVKADIQFDGTFLATRIKIEDSFEDEVELTGTIDTVSGPTLVIAGLTFSTDAATEIIDDQNNPLTLSALHVGLLVEVRATLQIDGSLLVTRIKIEDRIEDEIKIAGRLEQISAEEITVLGLTFQLTENTVVLDENRNKTDLSSLFVGQVVEIRGDLLPDGTLVAIRIEIEDLNITEAVGPIDTVGLGTLEVVGVTFFLSDTTEILDASNNPITLSDLSAGQTVQVGALGQLNGTRVATRVQIENVLVLSGVISQAFNNGISLVNREVLFDSNTLILGNLNKFLTMAELKQGQFVEVRALMGSGNTIFATKVRVQGLDITTSVESRPIGPVTPKTFSILENYPNPFNPSTTIRFSLPDENGGSIRTKLSVFNLLGQLIRTLVDEALLSGNSYEIQWDGRDANNNILPSGIYLYRLQAGSTTETARMTLLK